jgi:hypothetical protein
MVDSKTTRMSVISLFGLVDTAFYSHLVGHFAATSLEARAVS